ncbi:hypothetical protein RIMD111065_09770 [Aeromonas hydrophila]|nr:hypothetical protein RIMD111065_09770 [Aeromonas hydrophila]
MRPAALFLADGLWRQLADSFLEVRSGPCGAPELKKRRLMAPLSGGELEFFPSIYSYLPAMLSPPKRIRGA